MIKIIKAAISFIIIFINFTQSPAQDTYYDAGFIRNDNVVYSKNIQTVIMYKSGFELISADHPAWIR